jgi:hypothetical protein
MSQFRKSTLIIVVSCTLGVGGASIAAEDSKLEMGAYLDRPGGPEIVSQRYEDAILRAKAMTRGDPSTRLVAETNLCVAYTMTLSFELAEITCNRALERAMRLDRAFRRPGYSSTATVRALTNRGVLRYLSGDLHQAAVDFTEAERLDRGAWDAPGRNLALIEAKVAGRLADLQLAGDP